ncbi:uncharacterized protein V1518DRAFT_403393 [Limtongia smithiae]|uniref:uncharacterized protein n=1 Tax=Limtongia smithiae TaxID=1125753 RepID=UPI0034CE00AD
MNFEAAPQSLLRRSATLSRPGTALHFTAHGEAAAAAEAFAFVPPPSGRDTLDHRVAAILENIATDSSSLAALARLQSIIDDASARDIRDIWRAENKPRDTLSPSQIKNVADTLFKLVSRSRNQFSASVHEFFVAMHDILALALIRGVTVWPEKSDRMTIYTELGTFGESRFLNSLEIAVVRELVIATRPRGVGNKNYITRAMGAVGDPTHGFDHDALLRDLQSPYTLDRWAEKLVVVTEALRTPTNHFVTGLVKITISLIGEIRESGGKSRSMRGRDVSTDIIDGSPLSLNSKRQVFVYAIIDALIKTASRAYPAAAREEVMKLNRVLAANGVHDEIAALSFDADSLTYDSTLTAYDMWPPPLERAHTDSACASNSTSALGNTNGDMQMAYDSLKQRVSATNKSLLEDLRQLLVCPVTFEETDDMVSLSCGHHFSRQGINACLRMKNECPLCKGKNVTIHSRAMWAISLNDIIKTAERTLLVDDLLPTVPEGDITVGIHLGIESTVIGILYPGDSEMTLYADWASDTRFAIPSIVYVGSHNQPLAWPGSETQKLEIALRRGRITAVHFLAECSSGVERYSSDFIAHFLRGLRALIYKAICLHMKRPDYPDNKIRYLFSLPDGLFSRMEVADQNEPTGVFLDALNAAEWTTSAVEVIPETKCEALFAVNSDSAAMNNKQYLIHTVAWNYYSASQRMYALCPEDRFGIFEVSQTISRTEEVDLARQIELRFQKFTDVSDNGLSVAQRHTAVEELRQAMRSRRRHDSYFSTFPVSKLAAPKVPNSLYTKRQYNFDDLYHEDKLHIYVRPKTVNILLRDRTNLASSGSEIGLVPPHNTTQALQLIDDVVSIPMQTVADIMRDAAMTALRNLPRVSGNTSIEEPAILVVAGTCADDAVLMGRLKQWLVSPTFANCRLQGVITSNDCVGNMIFDNDKSLSRNDDDGEFVSDDFRKPDAPYATNDVRCYRELLSTPNDELYGKSTTQMIIDGLWIACKMIAFDEA